jgi:hypothetical protein
VTYDSSEQRRIVAVEPGEVLAAPTAAPGGSRSQAKAGEARVDASSEVALLIVLLLAAELAVRIWRLRGARRAATGPL